MKPKTTKLVRINEKTMIQVPINKPDAEARAEFLLKIEANERKYEHYPVSNRWK
jgi:hypothetical protein